MSYTVQFISLQPLKYWEKSCASCSIARHLGEKPSNCKQAIAFAQAREKQLLETFGNLNIVFECKAVSLVRFVGVYFCDMCNTVMTR
jgi:hypothetical protein